MSPRQQGAMVVYLVCQGCYRAAIEAFERGVVFAFWLWVGTNIVRIEGWFKSVE
ncbi:hypothetical protein D9M71_69160 [compost metagenome]